MTTGASAGPFERSLADSSISCLGGGSVITMSSAARRSSVM